MKRYLLLLLIIINNETLRAQDIRPLITRNTLESVLLDKFQILKKITGIQCDLYATTGETRAIPGKGIALNLEKIQSLYNAQKPSTQEGLLLLILGHELTHVWQYMNSPGLNIPDLSNDQKRVLEAQADLMGTKFVFNYYANFVYAQMDEMIASNTTITGKISTIQHQSEVTKEATDLFYSLGESNFNNSDHPSKLQRLNAVSAGLVAGLVDVFNYFIVKYQNLSPTEKQQWEFWRFYASINLLVPIIYMDSGEKGLFNWSMALAKTIIGYNREVAGDIVVMEKETHRVFSDVPEFITFNYKLKNIGSKPIKATVEFRIDSVSDDPKNVKLEAAKFLTRIIQPNELSTFADTLFFALPPGTFSSTKLVFGALSDPKAKFAFDYVGERVSPAGDFLNHKDALALDSHTLESFLSYLEYLRSNLVRRNYNKLIVAPGRYVNSPNYERYDFPVVMLTDSLIDASLNIPVKGDNKDQLTLRMIESKDYKPVYDVYNQVVRVMKEAYGQSYVITEDKDESSFITYLKSLDHKSTMMISFYFRNPTSDYSLNYKNEVHVTIFNH